MGQSSPAVRSAGVHGSRTGLAHSPIVPNCGQIEIRSRQSRRPIEINAPRSCQCVGDNRDVLVAEPLVENSLPLLGQALKGHEAPIVTSLDGESHVFDASESANWAE